MAISPLLQLLSPMTNHSSFSSIHPSSFVSAFQSFLDEEISTSDLGSEGAERNTSSSLFLSPEAASPYFQRKNAGSVSTSDRAINQKNVHSNQMFSGKTNDFTSLIESAANKYGVDPNLVHAVIQQESEFNPNAKSHAGAMGLMQLMPGTARYLDVDDPYDPSQNIEGGTRYLKDMLDRFNGDTSLALAAYNAGPGNVERYNGIPPFKETQNYVPKVMNNYHSLV
ncbi:lytic transglycosylase domain-containing protein [Alteribacillus sp. JSM 102045]|uniref:lytic transglycosylase domain-containing protein n=1 Tax=Alteribacillus sp. JSM 102045 TaxID=1562101 RepID=UPI0035C20AB6